MKICLIRNKLIIFSKNFTYLMIFLNYLLIFLIEFILNNLNNLIIFNILILYLIIV